MSKSVFLDKDGTLVEDVPFNVNLEKLRFSPNAIPALKLLSESGYKLFIISNQSGLAMGHFQESALAEMNRYISSQLMQQGIHLSGFYICPHHPEGKVAPFKKICNCRKPEAGLLFQAAKEHQLNLQESWFIGDILDDIEAGHKAGCRSILISNGNETQWNMGPWRTPDFIAQDLLEASQFVRENQQLEVPG